MTKTTQTNYHAYLLRLWRADENGHWHAMLQDSNTRQNLRFDSMESLYAYLNNQLGAETAYEPPLPLPPNEPPIAAGTAPDQPVA